MPDERAEERAELIGELKAGFKFLKENHEKTFKEIEKIANDAEESRRRIYERIEDHEHDNVKSFQAIGDALQKLIVVTSKIEQHEDRLDSNDRALLNHENRIAVQEAGEIVAVTRSKVNSRWLKGIGALLLALASDHFSGNHLSDTISHLLFGK